MNKYQNGKIYKIVDVGKAQEQLQKVFAGQTFSTYQFFFCLMNSAFKTVKLNGLKTIHVTIKMN